MYEVEKKKFEIFPAPDKEKQIRELEEIVGNMKPNTAKVIGRLRVEYHKTKGLTEHYTVVGVLVKTFLYKHQVVDYLLKQI